MSDKIKVFLCYAKEDLGKVEELYHKLEKEGFDPWLDAESILPGQKWKPTIKKAIRNSDYFIASLSKRSVTKDGFLNKEINWALEIWEEKTEGKIYLIPARLENCDVPERLKELQWVDVYTEKGFRKLLNTLRSRSTSGKDNGPDPPDSGNKNILGIIIEYVKDKAWIKITIEIFLVVATIVMILMIFPNFSFGQMQIAHIQLMLTTGIILVGITGLILRHKRSPKRTRSAAKLDMALPVMIPLMAAAEQGDTEKVRALLEAGADPNVLNKRNETALMFAVWNKRKDIVEILLKNSADVRPRNNYGETALDLAKAKGFTEIVELFRKYR